MSVNNPGPCLKEATAEELEAELRSRYMLYFLVAYRETPGEETKCDYPIMVKGPIAAVCAMAGDAIAFMRQGPLDGPETEPA